jgi:hypothetical protein
MITKSKKSFSAGTLFLLLAVSLALAMLPRAAFAASAFTDVNDDYWGLENIEKAREAGIIEGYEQPDGTWLFRPENHVTKQECITMLYRSLKLHLGEDQSLELQEKHKETLDASNIADWAREYVAYFLEQGWAAASDFEESAGERSGGFMYARRELIARWTAESMGYDIPAVFEQVYKDHLEISAENAGYVHALYREGIMEGSSGAFHPQSNVKRAEMAAVCTRVLGLEAREKHNQKALMWYGTLDAASGDAAQSHGDFKLKLQTGSKTVSLHMNKDAVIVCDGKAVSAAQLMELEGKTVTVSCYAGGENSLSLQTAPRVMSGNLVSDQELSGGYLLTMRMEDGSLVNYITNSDSKLPRRMVAGRDYVYIADGLTILELQ